MPVRLIVIVVLIGLWSWWVFRAWTRGDRTKLTWTLIAAFGAVIVWQGWLEHRWRSQEAAYAAATATIAPNIRVHCQRFSEALIYARGELGFVEYTADGGISDTAMMTFETCRTLQAWMRGPKTTQTLDDAQAVHILSHEAQHVRGEKNEAVADCAAMQDDYHVAVNLGATPAQARELATMYWTGIYPRMRDTYRTADCVENGPLDETPNDGMWP